MLPKKGIFKVALDRNSGLKEWLAGIAERKAGEERVREEFEVQNPDHVALQRMETARSIDGMVDGFEKLEAEDSMPPDVRPDDTRVNSSSSPATAPGKVFIGASEGAEAADSGYDLARQLAQAIKGVAQDLRVQPFKETLI